jgi:hypothetical protein
LYGLRRPAAAGRVAVAPEREPDDVYRQLSQYADGRERGKHELQD